MRLINFDSDFFDAVRQTHLKAGTDYVVTQLFAGYYSSICDGYLRIEHFPLKKFNPKSNWNGKKILVHRSVGGAGDLLFITPILRAIKEKWPKCHITFYCYEMYHWLFAANPHVDQCVDFPLPMTPSTFKKFDAHIDLEDAIEYSPLAHTRTATQVFAAATGIEVNDEKPVYHPSQALVAKLEQRFPKKFTRVAIALKSGSILRDYPLEHFMEVIKVLLRNSIEVVLLGGGGRPVVNGDHALLLDLTKVDPPMSWEENVAFIKTCDLVVGPDSSSIHFAGVMGVPSLGLYAAFPASLRISAQPATKAIQAKGPCAPCFAQDRGGIHFPLNGPCNQSRKCDVLATIAPQQVVSKIFEMIVPAPIEEPKVEKGMAKKKTCMISQPCGIGDILFIQKIILHFANLGYHVVVPIFENYAWMRHYLVPHPDVEYPLISNSAEGWTGDFEFADAFLALGKASSTIEDPENQVYKSPILYKGTDEESSFVFLALSSSYQWLNDRMMPSKYKYVGLDYSDWASHVHLKRRPHIEKELFYEVLGLKDDTRYTLVNEHASSRSLSISVPGNVVRLREIDGFTLIDWSMVVERATQIVTIDTSLVILTEILNQKKPLYMLSRADPPTFEPVEDILSLKWTLVPTPDELEVKAA